MTDNLTRVLLALLDIRAADKDRHDAGIREFAAQEGLRLVDIAAASSADCSMIYSADDGAALLNLDPETVYTELITDHETGEQLFTGTGTFGQLAPLVAAADTAENWLDYCFYVDADWSPTRPPAIPGIPPKLVEAIDDNLDFVSDAEISALTGLAAEQVAAKRNARDIDPSARTA